MSQQLSSQETLFGERDVSYGTIEAQNKCLFPFLNIVQTIDDECRLDCEDGMLHTELVDPSNVEMLDLWVGIENHGTEFTVGVNVDRLYGKLQNKPRSDSNDSTVVLDVGRPQSTLTVDNSEWSITERFGTIDPNSLREAPNLPTLENDIELTLDTREFAQVLQSLPGDNGFEFEVIDGTFRVGELAEEGTYKALAECDTDVTTDGEAIYSSKYLVEIMQVLSKSGVDEVTMEWDTDMPIVMTFESEVLHGKYMLAPRVRQE